MLTFYLASLLGHTVPGGRVARPTPQGRKRARLNGVGFLLVLRIARQFVLDRRPLGRKNHRAKVWDMRLWAVEPARKS